MHPYRATRIRATGTAIDAAGVHHSSRDDGLNDQPPDVSRRSRVCDAPRTTPTTEAMPRSQPARSARYRLAWVMIGLIGLALVVFIHLRGGPHHLLTFHANADKLEHVFAFGAMMIWFGQLYRRGMERSLICICLVLSGIVLEYVQHALGDYDAVEYGDMAADALGAILGWIMLRTSLGVLIERMDGWLASRPGGWLHRGRRSQDCPESMTASDSSRIASNAPGDRTG
jgi:VanZ family protein